MLTPEVLLALIAIVILLAILAAVVSAGRYLRKNWLSASIDLAIARLADAAQHHADVNAVVELVKQIDEQPDVIEQLKRYPQQVQAAALTHYANTLGASLEYAQKELEERHKHSSYQERVNVAQERVDLIRRKLDAVVDAASKLYS